MQDSNFQTKKVLAFGVHLFTASGLLAGFLAILAISERDFRTAFGWLFAALVIDSIDGTFARKLDVKKALPNFSGKTLDHVIDFANYALIPAYFFYAAGTAPSSLNLPLAFLILLASAIYYGKEGMVSEDQYFMGFPVMWNMVVFYLFFVFDFSPILNAAVIIIFAILHFVPIKFAYPSRAAHLKALTIIFTVALLILIPLIVWFYPNAPLWMNLLAVVCLLYFGALAAFDTYKNK